MKFTNEPDSKKKKTKIRAKRSLEYSLWLLGRRAYTQKQIREKLERKEYEEDEIEATVKRLIDLKFLDDLEFAKNYVRQSTRGKPKGKYRLTQELSHKGVEKELIEQALAQGLANEEDLAQEALARYGKKFENLDRQKRFEKSMRFLLSRGFSYNVAKKAFNDKIKNKE